MRRARSAGWSVAVLLLASASCQHLILILEPSTVQVVVLFNPNPDLAPPRGCTELLYVYTATRSGNGPDPPEGSVFSGDESASDTQRQACASRSETFTFPDNDRIKPGVWTFEMDVFADGVRQFGGTCSALTVRANASATQTPPRHVITFTQPQSGNTAACTFTL